MKIPENLLEQAPTDELHKHWGQDCYIAQSEELDAWLYRKYGRHGLCLKVFKHTGDDPPRYGGSKLSVTSTAQNLLAIDDLAPRIYKIVEVARDRVAQVTDYATGAGNPDMDRMRHLVKKYRLGLKGKKGDPVKAAVRYTQLPFKWVGRWFVDWGRFYFTDPKGYEARLRKKIQHRQKVAGKRVGYQDVTELGIPGQRDHRHRVKHMQLDGLNFKGKTVLDIGCNNGTMLREAVRRGAKWAIGVDDRRTHVWAELNNWLGYWGIDFLTLSMPSEWKAIRTLTGIQKFDIVFALAIVQHIEGAYDSWFAELTKGVFYLEGDRLPPEAAFQSGWEPGFRQVEADTGEQYSADLARDFKQVEWLGWIKDEDRRALYRCWQKPRPRWGKLPAGAKSRRTEAIRRGQSIFGRALMSREELGYLYDLALEAPDGRACEVGVFNGSSLMAWASARQGRGAVKAIDTLSREALEENIGHSRYPIEILMGQSWEVGELLQPQAFVFIDADHTKTGIPRDIAIYPSKVIPGGILVFHDYDKKEAQKGKGYVVKATVDAWQKRAKWENLGQVGRVIAFRKPL